MVFVHINPSNPDTNLLNTYIDNGKPVFVLFYLEGCGPCKATRPLWKEIENKLPHFAQNNNVVVADVDETFLKGIEGHLPPINSFPTIMFLSNKGEVQENYERERSTDAFVEWINSKPINIMSKPKGKSKSKSKSNNTTNRKTAKKRTTTRQYGGYKVFKGMSNKFIRPRPQTRARNRNRNNRSSKRGRSR